MSLTHSLSWIGIAPHAAAILENAASRPHGILLFCGPAGMGKTTVAQLVVAARARQVVHWLGDLRMPEEIAAALAKAANEPVVAVVRSGESHGLRSRWKDMELPDALVDHACVVTVTLRRLTRVATSSVVSDSSPALPDLLAVEILAPDGTAMTAALAHEARALVAAGMTTDDEARNMVPGYA